MCILELDTIIKWEVENERNKILYINFKLNLKTNE